MAIAISSGSPHITDTNTSEGVSWTGATYGAGRKVKVDLKVNGTIVNTRTVDATAASQSLNIEVSAVANPEIYNAATGYSLTGCVSVTVLNYQESPYVSYGSDTVTGGTLTISATGKLSAHSWSTTANPYNLDSYGALAASWSRIHTAFRGRVKVYVNNVLVLNRSGFGTSMSYTPTSAEITSMINAMGGVSPRALKYDIIPQFAAASNVDLTTSGTILTRSTGVIKTFAQASTISSFSGFEIGALIYYTISQATSGTTHDITLKIQGTTVLTRTSVGTGSLSITPSAGEITAMYNACPTTDTPTATLELITRLDGSQVGVLDSETAAVTLNASIKPNFTTITHSEQTTSPAVATIVGGYVQGISSLLLTITGAVAGTGSTIKSYKITLSTTTINAVSGSTGVVSYSGTNLSLVGRVTDNRDRFLEKTVYVTILPYSVPQITASSFYRTNSGGTADVTGTYARFSLTGSCTSLIVSTQKNSRTIKFYTKLRTSGTWTLQQTIAETTTLTYSGLSSIFSTFLITEGYDGKVELIDKFYTTTTLLSIASGVVLSWGKKSIAVGKLVAVDDGTRSVDAAAEVWASGYRCLTTNDSTGGLTSAQVIALVYPVGSIYIATVSTSPATLFGVGTWSAYGTGRVLVSKAASGTFVTAGSTGGAETHNHTMAHTHNSAAHTHPLSDSGQAKLHHASGVIHAREITTASWERNLAITITGTTGTGAQTTGIGLTGDTDSTTPGVTGGVNTTTTADGSTLMPYIVVYMWQRTA